MYMLLVAVSLLLVTPQAETPPARTVDRVLGAWEGSAEHAGETATVVVEFVRSGDQVWTVVSIPLIHAWRFPLAPATMDGDRVTAGPAVFQFDPAKDTLITKLPAELVPKYSMSLTLRRRGAVTPDARHLEAPVRQPAWTLDVGAPIWADVAVTKDLVVAGDDAGRVHGVDARSGRERWTFTAGGAIRARPVFLDGDVLFPADDGGLYRLDGRTGRPRWRVTIAAPQSRVALSDPSSRYEIRASAAAVAGHRLFVGTHEGRLLALDARNGNRLWEFRAADAIVATPVVLHGMVYCGGFDGFLYALDAETGRLAWKHDTGGAVTSAVASAGTRVIAGSRSYDLQGLDATSGAPQWTRYFWFSWVESPVTIFESTAYVGSSDAARVSSIDPATGRTGWSTDVGGSAWGQPAVTHDTVYEGVAGVLHYISPHRGSVIALDRATGRVEWWYPVPAPGATSRAVTPYGFAGSVAVEGGHVFAGGLDGKLYAFVR